MVLSEPPKSGNSVVLQSQIKVQVSGSMLLDHEAERLAGNHRPRSRRLGGAREIALFLILGEL